MKRFAVCVVPFLCGCFVEPAEMAPPLDVFIGTPEPVVGATIEVFPVDMETGEVRYDLFLGSGESDRDGRVVIGVSEYHDIVYLTATGGRTREYWSNEDIIGDERGHFAATVPYYNFFHLDGEGRHPVTMGPWTTIAGCLMGARIDLDLDDGVLASMEISQRLLHKHVLGPPERSGVCAADLTCLTPDWEGGSLSIASMYALASVGISALAKKISEDRRYSFMGQNTFKVTKDLCRDLETDARFTGLPSEGLSPNTLRADLGNAVGNDFLAAGNFGIEIDDVRWMLERMADNREPSLFGDAPVEQLDLE